MLGTTLAYLSQQQAITASAASTNTYKMGTAMNPGENIPLCMEFIVTTAFTATGSSTLTLQIQNDDNDSGYTAGPISRVIAKTELTKGAKFRVDFDGVSNTYYAAYYTVGVASFTAGKMDCRIRRA